MYKAKVNEREFTIKPGKASDTFIVNGKEVKIDMLKKTERSYHIIENNKSYNIQVLNINHEEKIFELRVNNDNYTVTLRDQYDELLHALGMDEMNTHKVNDLKAPMPGLVTNINVVEGQEVDKGDVLVTLEAMKMENTLKCTAKAVVKKIAVKKGAAVEKNQILIYLT